MGRFDNLPRVSAATEPSRTVTLGDLRELVDMAALLPDEYVVRGTAIPFHFPDLGNPKGGRIMTLALDFPDMP
jgi:hypothetical protein